MVEYGDPYYNSFNHKSNNGQNIDMLLIALFLIKKSHLRRPMWPSGANVTADVVLQKLKEHQAKKDSAAAKKSQDQADEADVKEGKEALRRYAELVDQRFVLRKRLRESRGLRIAMKRTKTGFNREASIASAQQNPKF